MRQLTLTLYQLLIYCALPFIPLRLLWRSRSAPAYRQRILERFGFYDRSQTYPTGVTVIHAVSVGETVAAKPLVEALLAQDPQLKLLITSMTPTGSERVKALFGDRVSHVYCPYDYPFAIARFLKQFKPTRFIVMETEWWPNLFLALKKNNIPLYLVNARLSQGSFKAYQRIQPLTSLMLACITHVAAQSASTKFHLERLGLPADKITITGNIKYDVQVHPDVHMKAKLLRTTWGERPVWIIASSHQGEESALLAAIKRVQEAQPSVLTVWAPRHIERFVPVRQLCEANGLIVARRSTDDVVSTDTQVYLGDSLGELELLYGCADVAFVGGSLIPVGGHNVLEPASMACAIITGTHLHNFQDISDEMLREKAMVCVADADALANQVILWLSDPVSRLLYTEHALEVLNQNRGAIQRVMPLIG